MDAFRTSFGLLWHGVRYIKSVTPKRFNVGLRHLVVHISYVVFVFCLFCLKYQQTLIAECSNEMKY